MMRRVFVVCALVSGSALACGWDYETLIAETGSLPCVEAVAVMRPAQHSPVLLQRRVEVVSSPLKLGLEVYLTDRVVLRGQAVLGGLGFTDGRLGGFLSAGVRL